MAAGEGMLDHPFTEAFEYIWGEFFPLGHTLILSIPGSGVSDHGADPAIKNHAVLARRMVDYQSGAGKAYIDMRHLILRAARLDAGLEVPALEPVVAHLWKC